jgi:Arc/MetJ-type ribon-helix-helix transcriptional regulator
MEDVMNISLPPDLEAYVAERVRAGAFASLDEFIAEAVRRKMEREAWGEQKVLAAEQTEISPLTLEDLDSIRRLIGKPRAASAS